MANNNQIYKMSNAGGFKSLNRYWDMLAGNTTWNPWSPQGAYDALGTVTVPSGGATTVTFNGIPTTYKHLQVRGFIKTASGVARWATLNFNGSSANWSYHSLYGDGSSAGAAGGGGTDPTNLCGLVGGQWGSLIIDVLDYTSTVKNKTARTLFGFDANGSGYVGMNSGNWNSLTAVNSITIGAQSDSWPQYSSFALYGIR